MSLNLFPAPTWLVGCGNMAGAMVDGWRLGGVELGQAIAIRPSGRPVPDVRTVSSLQEAGRPPELVILGFKPQKLAEIAPQLAPRLSARTTLISILAGVDAATLRARFPGVGTIVRAMPNLPVAVRRGVVALYSADADDAARERLAQLFSVLGFTHWTAQESEFAAVGAVAGAGPAYVARYIAAVAKAGTARGLDPMIAETVARETALGTAWLAAATGESMDALARRVASPNGTTEAGLAVLDSDKALEELIARTIDAAAARGAEIAAGARAGAPLAQGASLP
jgi:pyrroline-5-carboxylate reductase